MTTYSETGTRLGLIAGTSTFFLLSITDSAMRKAIRQNPTMAVLFLAGCAAWGAGGALAGGITGKMCDYVGSFFSSTAQTLAIPASASQSTEKMDIQYQQKYAL